MKENRREFLKAYNKHQKKVPDVEAIAKHLGYTVYSVRTLISKYKREGLIKDD
jgi:transposase